MDNILSIPYLQNIIFDDLSIHELFNLSITNKSINESVSLYSQNKINKYIIYFHKRLLKIYHNDSCKIYSSQYMSLYNYYIQISHLYKCLNINHQLEFQRDNFVYKLNHFYLPIKIYSQKLIIIKDIMNLVTNNIHDKKMFPINNTYWYYRKHKKWVKSRRNIWRNFSLKINILY